MPSFRSTSAALLVLATGCPRNPQEMSNPSVRVVPRVHTEVTVLRYPVSGSSLAEVAQNLGREHKARELSHPGVTYWQAPGTWESGGANGSCGLSAVSFRVDAHIILPQLVGTLSPPEVAEWHRFLGALDAHERAHVDIARKAVQDLIIELSSLPERESCAAFDDDVRDATRRRLDLAHAASEELDRTTDHGIASGAVLRVP